jgi:hypothetical protein
MELSFPLQNALIMLAAAGRMNRGSVQQWLLFFCAYVRLIISDLFMLFSEWEFYPGFT